MECKKKPIFKLLQFPISMGFALLGCVLLAFSQAIYVRDKTSFCAEESIMVKFLDVIGCALFVMPLALFLGNLAVRRILKFSTFKHSHEIIIRGRKWRHSLFWGIVIIIGIGVIMGALFPAGRDPFVPWSSAVAARGRNLFCMIEQNNARHKVGDKWCDPKMCSNSVEFITGVLNLIGVESQYQCATNVGVALWNVAVDVHDDYDELFPMLISANFNPRLLESTIDDDTQLPIGRASGASLSLLDDRAIIIVRKNGSSQVIKAKYCTKNNIFKTLRKSSGSLMYLRRVQN